ncbi:MAG: hypothetical protein DRJ09_04465 [Bacteroidetes bacterium]|nr:MAG: hypothetical protein DRJ09_04465 [Bacteroidota bacterium]
MKTNRLFHKLTQLTRDFFSLSKAEQHGIIVLVSLILVFTILYFTLPLLVNPPIYNNAKIITQIEAFQREQTILRDSLQIEKIQSSGQLSEALAKERLHPFPFDPNKLPRELWQKLGLTNRQIDVIKNYEAKGGKFYSKKDLKKLYSVSEAEYRVLAPYITIKPMFSTKGDEIIRNRKYHRFALIVTEINSADTIRLKNNLNLPFWLGKRVVAYRTKLGGFYDKKQLLEVYGMKSNYFNQIKKYVVVDASRMQKLCINQIGFKQLLHHPYCNYQLTKKIINARQKAGGSFSNSHQLHEIIGSDSLGLKLQHYLYICASDLRGN